MTRDAVFIIVIIIISDLATVNITLEVMIKEKQTAANTGYYGSLVPDIQAFSCYDPTKLSVSFSFKFPSLKDNIKMAHPRNFCLLEKLKFNLVNKIV